MDNVREFSNGENAASFFQEKIVPNGLYLLDEPENSLSAQRQIELVAFIEDMTRYEHCQFVIATHSPFVLSIKEAKIYDLDQKPVDVRRWTQLENVQTYYRFFQMHQEAFEDEKDVPINKNLLESHRKRSERSCLQIHTGTTDHSDRFNYHCCNRSNRLDILQFFCFLVSGIDQATAKTFHAIIKDHCLSWGDCPNGFIEDHFGTVII